MAEGHDAQRGHNHPRQHTILRSYESAASRDVVSSPAHTVKWPIHNSVLFQHIKPSNQWNECSALIPLILCI